MPKRLLRIGMRNIKTAIAVCICCLLYGIIGANGVMLASISAVLCMQSTLDKSVDIGKNRAIGSFIGGIVGAFAVKYSDFAMGSQQQIILVTAAIVLIIFACNIAQVPDSSATACVVFLVIVYQIAGAEAFAYAFSRVLHSLIGISAAIFVNVYLDLESFRSVPDATLQEQNIYPSVSQGAKEDEEAKQEKKEKNLE